MYMSLMDPIRWVLNGQDQEYLDLLKTVYVTMCENIEEKKVLALLNEIVPEKVYRRGNLTQLINDCEELFGRFRKVNKDFQRGLARERYKTHIKHLMDERPKNYMTDIAAFESLLIKIDRLDKDDTAETFDWKSLQLPNVSFTNNAAFLDGTEDIEILPDEPLNLAAGGEEE